MAKTVGAAIREIRGELGVSMRDLSRLTGMSTSYLSMIETGARKSPGFETVLKVARGLGISLDELATRLEGRSVIALSEGARVASAVSSLQKAREKVETLLADIDHSLSRLQTPKARQTKKSRR